MKLHSPYEESDPGASGNARDPDLIYLEEKEHPATGVRVNLGSGRRPDPDYINLEYSAFPGTDVRANLEHSWPFRDSSVDFLEANDILEHLRVVWDSPDRWDIDEARRCAKRAYIEGVVERRCALLAEAVARLVRIVDRPVRTYGVVHFMNEAFRVLRPGGILRIFSPDTRAMAWAQDPTHVAFFNRNTLLYFTNEDWRQTHGNLITARFEMVGWQESYVSPNDMSWTRAILRKPKK